MRLLKISVRGCVSAGRLIGSLSVIYILTGSMGARAAEMPLVRANYAAISGAFAPLWIATEKGLFTKHGLNVDLRYIAPATATQALLAKNLDIINPGGEKYTKTTDAKDLESSYQAFLPAWERLPHRPGCGCTNDAYFASHPSAKTAKPETLIDNSVLTELDKSGFVDKLYK